jgi:hypothetical protein
LIIEEGGVVMNKPPYGIFTEAGVDFGEGNIVKNDDFINYVTEAKRLYEDKAYDKFVILMEAAKEKLGSDSWDLLLGTKFTDSDIIILEALVDIDDMNDIMNTPKK